MEKNYCLISKETNICENVVIWDGDTSKWNPPEIYFCIPQDEIPVKIWVYNEETKQLDLVNSEYNDGGLGYSWDGVYLTQPKPEITVVSDNQQPATQGTQTL